MRESTALKTVSGVTTRPALGERNGHQGVRQRDFIPARGRTAEIGVRGECHGVVSNRCNTCSENKEMCCFCLFMCDEGGRELIDQIYAQEMA